MRFGQFFRIALFLLALCFLTESLGYLTHQAYNFFGILLLVFYGLSVFPFGEELRREDFSLQVVLLLIGFPFLPERFYSPASCRNGDFSLCPGASCPGKGCRRTGNPVTLLNRNRHFLFFPLLSFFSSSLVCATGTLSWLFPSSQPACRDASSLFFYLCGVTHSCYLPLFYSYRFFISAKKRPLFFYLSLISVPVLTAFYLMVMAYRPFYGKSLISLISDEGNFLRLFLGFLFEKDYPLTRYNYQMNGPVVLFFLYLIPLAFILWGRTISLGLTASKSGKFKNSVIFLFITVLATAVLTVDLPGTALSKETGCSL